MGAMFVPCLRSAVTTLEPVMGKHPTGQGLVVGNSDSHL